MTTTFIHSDQKATSSRELKTSTIPEPSSDIIQLLLAMSCEGLNTIYRQAADRLITDKAVAHVIQDQVTVSYLVPSELPTHNNCVGILFWVCSPYAAIQELEQAHIHITLVGIVPTSSNVVGVELDLSSRLYLGSVEMQTFFQAQLIVEGASSNFYPLLDASKEGSVVMPEHPTQQ